MGFSRICEQRRSFLKFLNTTTWALPFLGFNGLPLLFGEEESLQEFPIDILRDTPTLPLSKKLSLYNIHTGEWLKNCMFWEEKAFIPEALQTLKHFFRDYRTGQTHGIDPRIFLLLHRMTTHLGTRKPIHLVSGYRCGATNQKLAIADRGVAKKSLHLVGRAADIFIEGCSLKNLQKSAISLGMGGVGRYATFVHVDTGKVRRWGKTA